MYDADMAHNSLKPIEDADGNWVCEHGKVLGAEDCSDCDILIARHEQKICDSTNCPGCQEDYANYLNAKLKS